MLYFLGFLITMAAAIPAYSQSSFLSATVGLKLVSPIFLAANALTFFAILLFPRLIKQLKNYRSTRRIIFAYAIALAGLTFAPQNPWIMLTFFSTMIICGNLIAINMDIFLESFASRHAIGTIHSTYFTAVNFGWILSPFLAGFLIQTGGFAVTYAASLVCLAAFAFFFMSQGKNLDDKNHYRDFSLWQTATNISKNRDLRSIFFLAFLLSIFYSLVVVFLPVYLSQSVGFSWEALGTLFSLMLIPFILVEIPAGMIADRYLGEKELMSIGFIILSVSLMFFFLVKTPDFLLWAVILIFSRLGAALVESMREAYFFKAINVQDVDYINFFRATTPLGYVFGMIFAAACLMFMPFNQLFLAGAFLMCLAFPVLFWLRDIK